jgi:hypothetical protein
MIDKPSGKLMSAFGMLAVASLLVYGIGIFFMFREVCTGTGAWISMLGVAGGLVSCGVVGSCAVLVNTVTTWMVAIVTLLVVSGMYWLASGLALAGCSGV